MELVSPVLNTPGRPSQIFFVRHRSIARRGRPHRGQTQPISEATCSSASSSSRSVGSFVDPSSDENGNAARDSDVSAAFLSFAGNNKRGSKRRE